MCRFSLVVMVPLCAFLIGCGGGSSSPGGGGFTPANVQGQYESVAQSNSSPTSIALIEANFTQTGTDVFAGKQSVVLILGTQGSTGITLTGLGGERSEEHTSELQSPCNLVCRLLLEKKKKKEKKIKTII